MGTRRKPRLPGVRGTVKPRFNDRRTWGKERFNWSGLAARYDWGNWEKRRVENLLTSFGRLVEMVWGGKKNRDERLSQKERDFGGKKDQVTC